MEKYIRKITLNGYKASIDPADYKFAYGLLLGTAESYGLEQLQIETDEAWNGLTITATYNAPDGSRTRMLVGADGIVDVPPEATAQAGAGKIVISGVADGVQMISINVPYLVLDHAQIDGQDPQPTPSEWQQFVAAVAADAQEAAQSATAAEQSAQNASQSATDAATSSQAAAQSAATSEQSAQAADQSAKDAYASAQAAQQGAANAGWFTVTGEDGILYFVRSDNAPSDFALQDNGEGVLEAVYGN